VVDYSPGEGKAIIGLVDLMLKILKRAEELPPPDMFPENLEKVLAQIEEAIGPGAASRLRVFLGKIIRDTGLRPSTSAKQWIPFKRYCLYRAPQWDEPKPHRIAVLYLSRSGKDYGLSFPTASYYAQVVDFNVDRLLEELMDLGFWLMGKSQEPFIDLRMHNDQAFFDGLFDLIIRTADELEGTLQHE
jgi:hypothetical protein